LLPAGLKIPVSGIVSFRLGGGKKILMKTNESCAAVNYLFWRGGPFHYEYTSIFTELAARSEVCFDVGANVGYFTLLANAYNPDITVYAFEPASGPYHYLGENVKLNHCKNARIFQIALSDKNGTVEFFEAQISKYRHLDHHLGGSSSINPDWTTIHKKTYSVKTLTLDEFVRNNNVTRLDLLKLDAESFEHVILKHSHETLRKLRPIVMCEAFESTMDLIQQEIDKTDYSIYYYTSNGKLKPIKRLDVITEPGDRNFFLVPMEKKDWIKPYVLS
jgi:FkbM family methyltransferase